MRFRGWIAAAAAVLAGCASLDGPAAPAAEGGAAPPAYEDDPWAIMIEAERYSYLISLAREGAIEGPPAMALREKSEMERATDALRYAVIELYMLRDRVCETGLVGPEECGPLPPPDWLGEPAGEVADIVEVRRRIDWLTEAMQPFVEAGCDAGRSRQGPDEPDYCAVE